MISRFSFFVLLLLASVSLHPQTITVPDSLGAYISGAAELWKVPGTAVGIVQGDSLVYAAGFGTTSTAEGEKVTPATIFGIGSNTKAFTAAALGLLVAEGKLNWEDKVIDHLPDFRLQDKYAESHMTVEDLLSHRSGFGSNRGDLMAWGSNFTRREVYQKLRLIPPAHSFREKLGYSNSMYLVAGLLIEAVTGMTWDEYVRLSILQPLRMDRTFLSVDPLPQIANVSDGHLLRNDSLRNFAVRNIDNYAPCGSMNSSLKDVAAWLTTLMNMGKYGNKQILDTAVVEEMMTPRIVSPFKPPYADSLFPSHTFSEYGLGLMLMNYRGRMFAAHTGGVDGFLSMAGFFPEEKIGIIVLTNTETNRLFNSLWFTLADIALGVEPAMDYPLRVHDLYTAAKNKNAKANEPAETTPPPLPVEKLTGIYKNEILGKVIVSSRGEKLYIDLEYHDSLQGSAEHKGWLTWSVAWEDFVYGSSNVTFLTDAAGAVKSFSIQISFDSLDYIFKKVP